MDLTFGLNGSTILFILTTIGGITAAYIKNDRLNNVVSTCIEATNAYLTYEKDRADGKFTDDERLELGDAFIALMGDLEKDVGKAIINDPSVPFINPATANAATANAATGTTSTPETTMTSMSEAILVSGVFDPKMHPAEEVGIDANGNMVRGLKMPEARFRNMVFDMGASDQADARSQVDAAEAAGLRNYQVHYSGGYYLVENGIVYGNGGYGKGTA